MAHVRLAPATPTSQRGPSRLLVALAALWMVLSLAIGSALTLEPASGTEAPPAPITGTVDP